MNKLTPDDHVEYTKPTQEEEDILSLQNDPVFLRESLEISLAEEVYSRSRARGLAKELAVAQKELAYLSTLVARWEAAWAKAKGLPQHHRTRFPHPNLPQ